ncbi:response regulator transcription factor [Pseudogulbenkiania sp. MAI-1]|uniref:response regulator transcription factor n=1 Tax=Pseudogulbenkiania sp. MAI-1 TaxID=990370 RepID=UPI0018DB0233|nr:response regulator transcription factor [Pseudogulbenkiania sp. MAI-1]
MGGFHATGASRAASPARHRRSPHPPASVPARPARTAPELTRLSFRLAGEQPGSPGKTPPGDTGTLNNGKFHRRRTLVHTIRVLLANDRQIILWGLEKLINAEIPRMKVIAKAISNAELLSLTEKYRPDVTLLELELGGENNIDLIPDLLRDAHGRVLILSGTSDKQQLDRAVLNGAHGILRKEEPVEAIVKAIERVHEGELWLDRITTGSLFGELSGNSPPDPEAQRLATLTPRELDIIAAVVNHPGARTRELADLLYLSEHTLRNRLSRIYSKLDVANRLDLFAYASQCGLGQSPDNTAGS